MPSPSPLSLSRAVQLALPGVTPVSAADLALGAGSLVSITKSSSTGSASGSSADIPRKAARDERFALQNAARELVPEHRVARCFRRVADKSRDIEIKQAPDSVAFYANLQRCGSVWDCPVCSARVSERRREELRAAQATHIAAGGAVWMATLTFPHKRGWALGPMMQSLRRAVTALFSGRAAQDLSEMFGVVGTVRALEVTYGHDAAGWHPHFHILFFVDLSTWVTAAAQAPAFRAELREYSSFDAKADLFAELEQRVHAVYLPLLGDALYANWSRACVRAGLPCPSREHGVHVQNADAAAAYAAKFGLEPSAATLAKIDAGLAWDATRELVNANTKRAHGDRGGLTPFDLLRVCAGTAKGPAGLTPELAGTRFREYSESFFGFRQLFWSPGLKSALGITDLDDAAASDPDSAEAVPVVSITPQEWRAVLAFRRDERVALLRLAEAGGAAAVRSRVAELVRAASIAKKAPAGAGA